ncbi:MAG: DUF134 domain-containing protein [Bacteroidales bacterium]
MSPRIKRIRKVLDVPKVKGFKPYGPECDDRQTEPVTLFYEEYEALRLCDYDMYNHHQASTIMNVSRPTFTRIYASARQKLAKAFVEGRQISIEGGKVYFDSNWYHCNVCGCYFSNTDKEKPVNDCPLCGSQQVYEFNLLNTYEDVVEKTYFDKCICPNCGFEQEHQYGHPCNKEICPHCKSFMIRKSLR